MPPKTKPPLRIIRLEATNIKRLRAIDISPHKFINRLSGGNGAGKSSILDSIEWTVVGAKDMTSRPVRKGAVRGTVKISLGEGETADVVLTRTFHEGSQKTAGRLDIYVAPGKDGSVFEGRRKRALSPDELQDKLLREISFDPLEFMQMKPDQQYHVLRRISVQNIDMDELDSAIQQAYDERTPLNTQVKQLEAQFNTILVPDNLPTEKINEAELLKQLTEASDYNAAIERERIRREGIERDVERRLERIAEIRKQIERLQDEAKKLEAEASESKKTIHGWKPLEDPRNAAELAEELQNARTINVAIDRNAQKKRIEGELETARTAWKEKDSAVKEGERRKMEAIAHAEYPVEGLGFGDKEVMYNGLPFDQASHAEQISVSTAIGMRANNSVHLMWIKDGSLLDEDSLQIIADLAHEHDYQVWLECVDNSGNVGFYIEDGEVKKVNEEPLDKAKPKAKKKPAAKETSIEVAAED